MHPNFNLPRIRTDDHWFINSRFHVLTTEPSAAGTLVYIKVLYQACMNEINIEPVQNIKMLFLLKIHLVTVLQVL